MPLIRVTHQADAITAGQKAELAEHLTHAMLMAEAGADTPAGRSVAYVTFEERSPRSEWFVGGKPDNSNVDGGRFLFDVVLADGASDQASKSALHAAINEGVAKVLGVDATFPKRGCDWVLIHDIADGNWGVSGRTVGIQEIAGIVEAVPERTPFFEGVLAAKKRVRDAHGFPAGAGRN